MVAAGAGLINTMQRVGSSWGLRADRPRHRPHQELAAADARTGPLAAPGHQVAAVVGGYDRAFLIAGAFAAGASLVSMAAARSRRAAPSSRAPKRRPEHSSCRAGAR